MISRTRGCLPRRAGFLAALSLFAVSLSACSDDSDGGTSSVQAGDAGADSALGGGEKGGAVGQWCAAKAVLDSRCTSCHDGQGTAGTPMGLSSYADLMAEAPGHAGKKVWERVAVRIHADKAKAEGLSAMPPKNDMSAEQLAALDSWIAAGAPNGTGECAPSSIGANGRPIAIWDPALCDATYVVKMHAPDGGKMQIPASPQETFPKVDFDAPWGDEVVQVINMRPLTDNRAMLHHWILYDKAGPFITGWAPGDEERRPLPSDVGLQVPSGKNSMYLDMHYYNRSGQPQQDESGVELCVVKGANLRPNPAGVSRGLSQLAFRIPTGAADYTLRSQCTVRADRPVHLMTASPHAHRLARHMKFTVQKKDGTEIVMLDKPFLFGEQASYPLEPDVVIESGDKVITECVMTNDTDHSVSFGESNDNEMCFNFASYYPVDGFCCEELLGLQSCLFNGGRATTGLTAP
jgi:hypothetical protein